MKEKKEREERKKVGPSDPTLKSQLLRRMKQDCRLKANLGNLGRRCFKIIIKKNRTRAIAIAE